MVFSRTVLNSIRERKVHSPATGTTTCTRGNPFFLGNSTFHLDPCDDAVLCLASHVGNVSHIWDTSQRIRPDLSVRRSGRVRKYGSEKEEQELLPLAGIRLRTSA